MSLSVGLSGEYCESPYAGSPTPRMDLQPPASILNASSSPMGGFIAVIVICVSSEVVVLGRRHSGAAYARSNSA